jgi:hypothetical protein
MNNMQSENLQHQPPNYADNAGQQFALDAGNDDLKLEASSLLGGIKRLASAPRSEGYPPGYEPKKGKFNPLPILNTPPASLQKHPPQQERAELLKPLTEGEVSVALMPESEEVKRRVGGLVAGLIRSLWQLRAAHTNEEARKILTEVRDNVDGWLERSDCVVEAREIVFNTASYKDVALTNPQIKRAYDKFMAYADKTPYTVQRGGVTKSVVEWLKENFVAKGRLSPRELSVIPVWMFGDYDGKLGRAIHDFRKRTRVNTKVE